MPKTLLDRKTNEKERGTTEEKNETRKYRRETNRKE